MTFAENIVINIYSIILLMVIHVYSVNHADKRSHGHKLYINMVRLFIVMLIFDTMGRFDGRLGTVYPILNHTGNFMLFMLNNIPASLWLLYVHNQIYHDTRNIKPLVRMLVILNAANAILVMVSQFTGWLYYIDSNNIYHRGPLFWLPVLTIFGLLLSAFALILFNKKRIEKRYYSALLLFGIPPAVSMILQVAFYGTSLILNSVVISLLIVFLNIQYRSLYTDYLTGINNRSKLENYLKEKINTSKENKTFAAIMLDLDNFKQINDTFGHDVGDAALETFTKLLKSSLRTNDFIARYGGDEFYIILEGVSNERTLESTVQRIRDCINRHNNSRRSPFKLNFSVGYAVYDVNSRMNAEEFQKHLDKLMYENKRAAQQSANI